MIERIFKLGLLVLLTIFLYLYSQDITKGRYVRFSQAAVLDSETGQVYTIGSESMKLKRERM